MNDEELQAPKTLEKIAYPCSSLTIPLYDAGFMFLMRLRSASGHDNATKLLFCISNDHN